MNLVIKWSMKSAIVIVQCGLVESSSEVQRLFSTGMKCDGINSGHSLTDFFVNESRRGVSF